MISINTDQLLNITRRYPIAYHTVDILAYQLNYPKDCLIDNLILLGRKPGQTKFQIPGGFVDPADISAEEAALREFKEETSLSITSNLVYSKEPWKIGNDKLFYEGSFQIDDERYRDSVNKIITSFYSVSLSIENIRKEPIPTDDLEELKWFQFSFDSQLKLDDFLNTNVVDKHHVLLKHFFNNWVK